MDILNQIDKQRDAVCDDNIPNPPDGPGITYSSRERIIFRDEDNEDVRVIFSVIRESVHELWRFHQVEFAWSMTKHRQAILTKDEIEDLIYL